MQVPGAIDWLKGISSPKEKKGRIDGDGAYHGLRENGDGTHLDETIERRSWRTGWRRVEKGGRGRMPSPFQRSRSRFNAIGVKLMLKVYKTNFIDNLIGFEL